MFDLMKKKDASMKNKDTYMGGCTRKTMRRETSVNNVIQMRRQSIAMNGLTHMVRTVNSSLFDGQEVAPPFGQLVWNEVLEIDNEKTLLSRRGPNQEIPSRREADRIGDRNHRWFQILKVKRIDTKDDSLYVREGTFRETNNPNTRTQELIDEMLNLLDNIVPLWANIHRAMQMESMDFRELSAAPPRQEASYEPETFGLEERHDTEGIVRVPCRPFDGEKSLHFGTMRAEKINDDQRIFVRVYLTIISPQKVKTENGTDYTRYKDVQYSEGGQRNVRIYGSGIAGSPDRQTGIPMIFFNIGKPLRAYAWAEKYAAQEKAHGRTVFPVIRSFLVPLKELNDQILKMAVREYPNIPGSKTVRNIDVNSAGNQFGISGDQLKVLRAIAVPGSLISYSDGVDPLDETAGTVYSLSAMRHALGIPDTKIRYATFYEDEEGPKIPRFRAVGANESRIEGSSIEFNWEKNQSSSRAADELENVYACWSKTDQLLTNVPNRDQLLVIGENQQLQDSVRKEVVRKFLESQYPTNNSDEAYRQDVIDSIEAILQRRFPS